ncbi:uncharacterized protein Pyn_12128 [Prunus yedoensis var. nudiflora]|uniref:Uncharacterized protein n=1 Tax=Prunus yedoensis var. nudiflora TaxID=2094558 RepID=A0A314ZJK0_PRUYE|nr:uncharacterized protein Pyn_12128 [Prunus yedoensis var. nudiflora]
MLPLQSKSSCFLHQENHSNHEGGHQHADLRQLCHRHTRLFKLDGMACGNPRNRGFVLALVIVLNLSSHHDIEFHINSLSVSPFIVYSSSATANWSITLLAKNHYKDKSIYFDAMQISVFYQKEFLTMTNVVFNETAGPKND